MPGGRPPYFSSPDELEAKIDEYFKSGEIITLTGLAYYLGFEDRQSLYDYQNREEYSCIIKRARLYVEMRYEQRLSGNAVTGAIFALKNMGWKDKQETEHSGQVGTTVVLKRANDYQYK